MNNSNVFIVNNTTANLSMFLEAIIAAAKAGAGLPEDIADIFTMKVVAAGEKIRIILNWA